MSATSRRRYPNRPLVGVGIVLFDASCELCWLRWLVAGFGVSRKVFSPSQSDGHITFRRAFAMLNENHWGGQIGITAARTGMAEELRHERGWAMQAPLPRQGRDA